MIHKVFKYLCLILLLCSFNAFATGNWYEAGDLHKADIKTWKISSYENKLATASDWAISIPSIKSAIQSSGDFDTAKIYAHTLVTCMDTTLDGVELTGDLVDLALSCMAVLGWLE